jgi:hypothetical protein
MQRVYSVAGLCFSVSGEKLCGAVDAIDGFAPFGAVPCSTTLFSFVEGDGAPDSVAVQYEFMCEGVRMTFGSSPNGYILEMRPATGEPLFLWCEHGGNVVSLSGNFSVLLLRFALWIGYGIMALPYAAVAVHSSCVVYKNRAVLFLGESGTGKSTHTRLWCENIGGASLLNDDSPVLRVVDGRVWAYGTPWSGKTPCYINERYEVAACVRLSQAPCNEIKKLSVLQAYAALHPSCPPEFAYDECLYDEISGFIGKMLPSVPFYHLCCRPDSEAALLSCRTIFGDEGNS